jgi:predicted RNA-binding protein YlqC (UPF0109 family)
MTDQTDQTHHTTDESKTSTTPDPTQSLVEQIARALVDHPDAVEVQAIVRDESTVLRLHVSDADIGKVIGKQGRTAHSLRTILSAVSMKYHHRYTLDIVETGAPHATASSLSASPVPPPTAPSAEPTTPTDKFL